MGLKYRYKTRPYKHQVKAVKKLLRNGDGGELFMEPRTGKSKTWVDYVSILAMQRKIDKVVIVCPARVMDVWVQQFHQHCPLIFNVTVWDAKARKAGPPPPARKSYDLNVVVVNYDAFATPGKRLKSGRRSKASGRFKTRQLLRTWMHSTDMKTAMVLDESHRIASPSGSAANMIVSMQADAQFRGLLTGTPVTKAKKAHDLYMQYKFRAPDRFGDLRTADEFKNAFGRWIHDNGYPQWVGPKNQAILQKRIHETGIVVRREDCFDLPPQQVNIQKVPLKGSSAVYDDMATNMVATIVRANRRRAELERQIFDAQQDGNKKLVIKLREAIKDEVHTVEASIKLVQGLRLRQITGGVATTDEGKLIRVGREKLDALKDILEAHAEHEEKLVIAAQFRADIAACARMARRDFKLPTYELKGGVSRDQATRDIRDFERHDGAAVFVVQPQSGSEGIDLSSAAHLVWYSLTPSWVKYTQMTDRIALSKTSTTITYLLGENTVDEVLYDTLQTDGQVSRAILEKPSKILRDSDQMANVEALLNEWEL